MRTFATSVPLFLPTMIVVIVLAVALAPAMARRLRCHQVVAALMFIGAGLVLSATLTPLYGAITAGIHSTGTCDTSRMGWASFGTYLSVNETSLNVLLFVPLGIAVGLVPGRAGMALTGSAILVPVVVETIQMLLPILGRSCQTRDVVDNTTGLVIGLGLGWFAARVARARGARTS